MEGRECQVGAESVAVKIISIMGGLSLTSAHRRDLRERGVASAERVHTLEGEVHCPVADHITGQK